MANNPCFKWREHIRQISPYLEDELDALYASLQANDVYSVGDRADTGADETITETWHFETLPTLDSLTGYVKGSSGALTGVSTPLPAADLGTGTPSSSTFLRGDQTWNTPPSSLLWFVGSLGGSRQLGVRHSTWTPVPEYTEVVLDTTKVGTSAIVRVEVKTENAATSVTPRLWNVTDGSVAGTGTASTSTSWSAQSFTATLPVGEKRYRLELLPSSSTHQVFGTGTVEPFTGIWGGSFPVLVYNVKDYGAAGDGTTDDTSAIQAAIDAAGAHGVVGDGHAEGATVFFPHGTYRVSSIVIGDNGVRLLGEGWYSSEVMRNVDANSSMIRANASSGQVTIENLRFTIPNSYVNANVCVELETLADAIVKRSWFRNGDKGLILDRASSVLVEGCFFEAQSTAGLYGQQTGYANVVNNLFYQVTSGSAGRSGSGRGVAAIWWEKVGGYLFPPHGVVISSNAINRCGYGDAIHLADVSGATVVGNAIGLSGFLTTAQQDIHLVNCAYVTVTGNSSTWVDYNLLEVAPSAQYNVLVDSACTDIWIGLNAFATGYDGSVSSAGTRVRQAALDTSGSCTLSAAATTVVSESRVTANSVIFLMPTNASAATLMSGSKSLYISSKSAGVSFTVATADGTSAAGTETFNYWMVG